MTTMRYIAAALAVAALAGCDRPRPVLLCHNSNCVGTLDASRDDTMPALQASLALGPAVLDGVEIDAVWQDNDCHFAHDVGDPAAPLLVDALDVVVDYLKRVGPPHSGATFTLLLELKSAGDANADLDRCVSRAVNTLERVSHEVPIQLLISSFDQKLLKTRALKRVAAPLNMQLGAEIWTTSELGALRSSLDFVSVTPSDTDAPAYARYADQGYDVALWNEGVTPTFLDAVALHAPRYVSVGEAAVMRAWIGN
jgi:hypothetical protein